MESGDTCGKLANNCGIAGHQFESYNTKPNLCSGLVPGQVVCCSAGSPPDLRPKRQPNGECAVYNVPKGDFCSKIATKHDLTVQELDSLTRKTWGWSGCNKLYPNAKLCLSEDWASLNPCPLKACCNVWGKCGTTEDFCVNPSTGAPGTSSSQNGCVANCGLAIVNNKARQAIPQYRLL